MRESYRDGVTGASATLMPLGHEDDGTPRYLITYITVNTVLGKRGVGSGSEMLRRVTAEAEQDGVVLCASVQPDYSAGSLDFDQLVSWYKRHGFTRHPESLDDEALVRYPEHRSTSEVPVATALLLPDMTAREAVLAAEVRRLQRAVREVDLVAMVREFHDTFGSAVRDVPVSGVPERAARQRFFTDEVKEAIESYECGDFANMVKEHADVTYVLIGTALTHGVPFAEVFREVHRANMSKVGPDGRPIIREDGKVLKEGTRYAPPDIGGLLREGGWVGD